MKKAISKVAQILVILTTLSATSAFADGNCQHPYCDTSSGYDLEHGYNGNLSSGAPTQAQAPVARSASDRLKAELEQVGTARFTASDYKPGLIRHIVLFRYGSDVTAAQKAEAKSRFLALKRQAVRGDRAYIVSIEAGDEISGEGADQALEQGFIVTFRSQGDRNFYVGQPIVTEPGSFDPAHDAFKAYVGPLLDQSGALVFDFASQIAR